MGEDLRHTREAGPEKLALTVAGLILLSPGAVAMASTEWNLGDVFVGVSNGQYDVYDNDGVFKETIDTTAGGFTTGCAFSPDLTRLYTTAFTAGQVVVFDNAQPHDVISRIQTTTQGNAESSSPESIVFRSEGSFLVGHANGDGDVHEYNQSDTFVRQFDVQIEARGSDWLDLAADGERLFYTSEGQVLFTYGTQPPGAQLPNFSNQLTGGPAYALRLLPPGDGSGGALVADTANVKRLDGLGNVVQTYDAPGEDDWFALNLDPNGTSFWSGDFGTDNFYRFNIDSGASEVGPVSAGFGGTLFGICVKGELTATLPSCDVDQDSDVDRNDIGMIFAARRTPATGADDPFDFNGDGFVTVNDARACALRCTNAQCAP